MQPRVIVALGGGAVSALMQGRRTVTADMLGRWMQFEGIDLLPTYHPERIALHPEQALSARRVMWGHMLQVLMRVGREAPKRS